MKENYKMFCDNGATTVEPQLAYMLVIYNEGGVDEVREKLRKADIEYRNVCTPGVYWWDEELDKGYRKLRQYEIEMFKAALATL
jgi:hypothetical protein